MACAELKRKPPSSSSSDENDKKSWGRGRKVKTSKYSGDEDMSTKPCIIGPGVSTTTLVAYAEKYINSPLKN